MRRGYTSLSEDGSPAGVVVDYLNEIAKYTGWKYEYVSTSNAVGDFQDGKFDLMGGTFTTKVWKTCLPTLTITVAIRRQS